jgi:tetratricopeptide (TPR) repeat protein
MYDLRRPGQPVTHVVHVSPSDGASAKIEELADSLVAKLVGTPAAAVGTSGTRSFAALKRYAEGYAALHEWNTRIAEQIFSGAVDLDPRFPQAWLGLAQSMAWGGRRAPEWREAASRALADSVTLSPRDRLLAKGLLALSEWQMAEACGLYRAMIARDPRDFAAHFGLGDCLSMDRLVVPDRTSPTGWRFRGSLHTAIQEYQRALALAPAYLEGSRGQTFARLTDRILFDEPGHFRRGFALAPDTIWMSAFPELQHDTLAFFPRPREAFAAGAGPPTHREAVARNRQLLRTLSARWVTAYRGSAAAWEHFAGALESVGVLDTLDETRRGAGALGAIAHARRLGAVSGVDSIRQGATHVRVLIKLRRFGTARIVAESILASRVTPSAAEANLLAPLAALTGRARLTARLFSVAAADPGSELFSDLRGGDRQLPTSVLAAAGTFGGYAALGAPWDSLRVARARVDRLIRSWVTPRDQGDARAIAFFPSDFQGQPAVGAAVMASLDAPRQRLLAPWQSIARGDTAAARRLVSRDWPRLTSPDVTPAPDVSLQYALLALALHDTATAAAILDRVAASIAELGSRVTTEVFPAAALPRVLALRASLTRPMSADAIAMWPSAKELWSHADPELRPPTEFPGLRKVAPPGGAAGSQKRSTNPTQ